jgi:hypothetical protein
MEEKKMLRNVLMAALLAAVPGPSVLADTEFRAINRMTVTPAENGVFYISGRATLWARDYWCAAGEYALRRLRLPETARIYVVDPYRPGRNEIGFSTDPGGLEPVRIIDLGSSVREAGSNLSVAVADSFCGGWNRRNSR